MAVRGRKRRSKASMHTGCLLWILALLVFLVLFALRFNDIKDALQKSGLLDVLNRTGESVGGKPAQPTRPAEPAKPPAPPQSVPAPLPSSPALKEPATKEPSAGASIPTQQAPLEPGPKPDATLPPQQPPSETSPARKTRTIALYFVRIGEDGQISSQRISRTILASDTPLQDAADALLKGPAEAELRAGVLSLIPSGTRLRSISLQGSTAVVDLSEEFMYNRYGREGYAAQLRQLVFTLTEFGNVSDVRILVEGRQRPFLTEGLPLDKPYRRTSF